MDIIKALKVEEVIEYTFDKKKRMSYEYAGSHYLSMNLESELIELGIQFQVVEYEFIEDNLGTDIEENLI